jgi:pre-rRNA-processing protein TSR1
MSWKQSNISTQVLMRQPRSPPAFAPSSIPFLKFHSHHRIERFKQSLQYIIPPSTAVPDVLDTCLPADFILLLLSSTTEVSPDELNTLRSILAQGTPSIIPLVANLTAHDNPKTRAEVKKSLLSYIRQYIPTVERVYAADEGAEAATVMRIVCTGIPNGIRWREQRSYVLPEGWRVEDGMVSFSGMVRGRPLQVDRLMHLPSYGDFQIEKVPPNGSMLT